MGLRIKLLIPTLIGFIVFAGILNFYWAPNHIEKLSESFKSTQQTFIKTIEPEIIRTLISNDYAALIAFLDQQLEIHEEHWKHITLRLESGDIIYPIFETPAPNSALMIRINNTIYDGEDRLATLQISLDWSTQKEDINKATRQIQTLLLVILALIIAASTMWQTGLVISPLLSLQKAVKRLTLGDYDAELSSNRNDEVGELMRNFDRMRTERKQAEESLRIAATAFNILEGIMITNNMREIIRVNPAFTLITGYSEEEAIGQKPNLLRSGHHSKSFYDKVWKELTENGQWTGEIWNKRKNGELYPQWTSINVIKDEEGNITHYLSSFLDISENKAQQQQLEQKAIELEVAKDKAEVASRAKSDFLATMSHEIRTPMNGVLGMTQLLLDTHLNKEQRDYLETIRFSGQNLLTIINDILDFSKIEANKMELEPIRFDLHNNCFEVARILTGKATEKNLELLFHIDDTCPHFVIGDPGRLRQVLLNLLGNAIKFTENGYVLLEIRCLSQADGAASLKFSVKDTGMGIDDQQQQQLFKPFTQADSSTTRKFGGTGLGLSISNQLVGLMGSRIIVESKPGFGSEFSFTISLPVTDTPEPIQVHDLVGLKILAVDDNSINLKLIEEQLSKTRLKITTVDSPYKALALLEKENDFDAIILDFCMPDMDGEQLGKRILENPDTKNIPLILLTSAGQRGDVARFENLGFSGYLTKPTMGTVLTSMISVLTNKNISESSGILTSHSIIEAQSLIRNEPVTIVSKEQELSPESLSQFKILLAEDDIVNQQVARGALEKLGFTPDIANNGREAVEKASGKNYDLILMDCQMPEMDGFEATRQLRQQPSTTQTPIIALTANAQASDQQNCLSQGMNDFLAKPFEFENLREVIFRWLPSSAPADDSEAQAAPETEQHTVPADTANNPVEPEEESSTPLIDWNQFENLKLTLPGSFIEIVSAFIQDTTERMKSLDKLYEQKNYDKLAMIAHSLKSSGATLGAMQLADIARKMEKEFKTDSPEQAAPLISELQTCFEKVSLALSERIN